MQLLAHLTNECRERLPPLKFKQLSELPGHILCTLPLFVNTNKLVFNSNKSHLMIMTSSIERANHQDFGLSLNKDSEIIVSQSQETLLGVSLSNCLSWHIHIRDSNKSLISKWTIQAFSQERWWQMES